MFRALSSCLRPVKMIRPPPRDPIVAVIGATGTGKSELAVEIALKYNGEIINGDAMQMYDGLPIITNKATTEERRGVPHHLLGCIGLHETTWSVGDFTKKALSVIQDIRSRGRLPILVGGTHYYTQSLLFQDALTGQEDESTGVEISKSSSESDTLSGVTTADLLTRLREVDPVMADRWHPNDRRKIQRSLEIWYQTGQRASDIYEQQKRSKAMASTTSVDDSPKGGEEDQAWESNSGLRFPTLFLWPYADSEVLKSRLDSRVDKMLAGGLLDEVKELDTFLCRRQDEGLSTDKTRGIWVSIGYKEFVSYVEALRSSGDSKDLETLKQTGIEQTKAATRQYAKRQIRWIRIKLLHALADASMTSNLFLLDGSDLGHWSENVVRPGLELTGKFLNGGALPAPTELTPAAQDMLAPKRDFDMSNRRDKWAKREASAAHMADVSQARSE
ncbi:tRNA isopentenyltransferase [Xylona heveae TC161]|uniref:tRNA dimethylallyltransferase n=1 Tax=Xylona heveae (strain CBS 132557 / TC161) TaxID=1328760 RepID=A0A165FR88_XYLHT|nr:tRNA isopentenyltransferase [Xylona heveae TC161]KZF21283.1 tRNA isopentenyltransferase [Xylona heveae TC161]